MPIEIRELVVTMEVDPSNQASTSGAEPIDQAELVQECVHKVLEVLENQKER